MAVDKQIESSIWSNDDQEKLIADQEYRILPSLHKTVLMLLLVCDKYNIHKPVDNCWLANIFSMITD